MYCLSTTALSNASLKRVFIVSGIFGGANSAINKKIDDTHDEAVQELIKYTINKWQNFL